MFPSASYAEWKKVDKNVDGDSFYVDFERIRKVDGYVYWWSLDDYVEPDKLGHVSEKRYNQGDCKLFRVKYLSVFYFENPMGEGKRLPIRTSNLQQWVYPPPKSVGEVLLESVCSR